MLRVARSIAAGAAIMLASCAAAPPAGRPAAVADGGAWIAELESRFAEASRARGARAAFLEFLAADSIVLQPGPVWGRATWEAAEDLPGTLDWAPDMALLSAGGELGFSTGPWTLRPREPGPVVEGRYLSVWRRTADGWRVVFDGGFGRKPGDEPLVPGAAPRLDPAPCEPGPAVPSGELQLADLALSGSASGEDHAARVLARAASGLVVFHPPDVEGARDGQAQRVALSALPVTTQLWPMGAGIAGSGDLGFSYGLSAPAPDATADAAYVHVWCRAADGWRLLVALRTPLSPS